MKQSSLNLLHQESTLTMLYTCIALKNNYVHECIWL